MSVHSLCVDVPGAVCNPGPLVMGMRSCGRRAVLRAYPYREQVHRMNAPGAQRALQKRFFFMFKQKRTPKVQPLLRRSEHAYSSRVWLAGVGRCPCAGRSTIRRMDRVCITQSQNL